MPLMVPATPIWRRTLTAVFGMTVVVVGVFESDGKGGRRFAVRSVAPARGGARVTKRRQTGAAKQPGQVATQGAAGNSRGRP